MGTLTADCPRLEEHCPHKLPSSCRLTSTPQCCACADIRAHSTTYRVYIDGVGFVQRGTRWQSYCWFCKSFWDARVAAAGLSPSDSRIPDDPDQTEFVARWFDWHRGYRIEKSEGEVEEKIALEGEPLKDADPGFLPRTWEELRRGQRSVLSSDVARGLQTAQEEPEPQVSLEDALDELLEEATDDEEESDSGEVYEVTTAAQRRPSNRSQPTSASVAVATQQENQSRLDDAYAEAQTAVEAAQRVRDRAEARLNNADAELAVVRERLRRIRRQQITAGNFARVFGTREDVNNADYVSPITSMFIRQAQWGRQNAERQRMVQEQADALRNFAEIHMQSAHEGGELPSLDQPPSTSSGRDAFDAAMRTMFGPQYIGDSHTFVPPPLPPETSAGNDASTPHSQAESAIPAQSAEHPTVTQTVQSRIEEIRERIQANPQAFPNWLSPAAPRVVPAPLEPVFAGLDGDSRPEPKKEEAMQFKLECKICLQQIADTACLPCGHLSMCEWCADQWVPARENDRTRPREKGVRCPCCRARVKSRVKIYVT